MSVKPGDASKGLLSKEQLEFFDTNGYLVIQDFASGEEMDSLRDAATRIVEAFDPNEHRSVFTTVNQTRVSDEYFLTSGDKIRCFFEADAFDDKGKLKQNKHLSINKLGHAMHDLDPAFHKFSDSPANAVLAKSLGYKDPMLVQSMYIFKQPSIGAAVTPHQDSTFLYTEPNTVTGMWYAVEDATEDNGCLWAVPGSHKLGSLSRFIRNPKGDGTVFTPENPPALETKGAVSLPVPKGSLVLIHGNLVHYSLDNRSPKSRHAFTLHVIEGKEHAKYPKDNWLQRADGSTEFMRFSAQA